jgi:hypothetical protein
MTPEKQRIAIAEACGWKCTAPFKEAFACWVRPGNSDWQNEVIPDFCNDLNAIADAEMKLGLKYDQWTRELRAICERDRRCVESATAAQRAEAFLRTIGKWEEPA